MNDIPTIGKPTEPKVDPRSLELTEIAKKYEALMKEEKITFLERENILNFLLRLSSIEKEKFLSDKFISEPKEEVKS